MKTNNNAFETLTAALVATASLGLLSGCGESSSGTRSGPDEPVPQEIQEYVDESVGRYVGQFEPASSTGPDEGNVKHYEFAVPDDPVAEPRGPLCLRGAPFTMATRDNANSDELFIYMQGGGACWTTDCSTFETANEFIAGGILDDEDPENPLAEWDVVFIPSCDGSVYVGDVDRVLPPSVLADPPTTESSMGYQRGLQNLSASLDVAKREFPNPSRVIVVGASAGGFGSIIATPLVRSYYPGVDLLVFNDSGVGVAGGDPEFINTTLLEGWNADQLIPSTCPDCTSNGHATRMIDWNLERDPDLYISAFAFSEDILLITTFIQIPSPEYARMVVEETGRTAAMFPDNYKRMIVNGINHTAIQVGTLGLEDDGAEFFFGTPEDAVQGVTVNEWMTAMIDGTDTWRNLVDEGLE